MGVILSPGYPDNYPNLQMCSWLINVEKGYNITLHFEIFQTEKEFDILEIFDGGFCWNFVVFVKKCSKQDTKKILVITDVIVLCSVCRMLVLLSKTFMLSYSFVEHHYVHVLNVVS